MNSWVPDTKTRIIQATLDTLKREGIAGTSARTIAATGGFAPGLVFYHFGGVSELLLAAVQRHSEQRRARYAALLADVEALPDLVAVARALHREDVEEGSIAVLVQILAGAVADQELATRLLEVFGSWMDVVEDAFARVFDGTPASDVISPANAAFSVTALFLGIELLTSLGEDGRGGGAAADGGWGDNLGRPEQLFAAFSTLAGITDGVLDLLSSVSLEIDTDA